MVRCLPFKLHINFIEITLLQPESPTTGSLRVIEVAVKFAAGDFYYMAVNPLQMKMLSIENAYWDIAFMGVRLVRGLSWVGMMLRGMLHAAIS